MKYAKPELYPKREFKMRDPGPTFCEECHAVHEKKRWFVDDERYQEMLQEGLTGVTCQACQMIAEQLFDGQLTISWERLAGDEQQKQEILSLIHNTEDAERQKNPLSRVVSIEDRGAEIEVLTTTEFLATHLGHAVDHAYNGQLKVDHAHREDFTRVTWHRED